MPSVSQGINLALSTIRTRSLGLLLPLDGLVNFLAVHGHVWRGINANPNLLASDIDDCYLDIVTNHYRFVSFSAQHQHVGLLSQLCGNIGTVSSLKYPYLIQKSWIDYNHKFINSQYQKPYLWASGVIFSNLF